MKRFRSRKSFDFDHDFDSEQLRNIKPRFDDDFSLITHRCRGGGVGGDGPSKPNDLNDVVIRFRILCHEMKAGGVIGKSGNVIQSVRKHTGAWIYVHQLIPGDEERVIEILEKRRRDPIGEIPAHSPAQEALMMIRDLINGDGSGGGEEEDGGMKRKNRVVATRLIVSRMNVGCLLGTGGKIIEKMRMETNTRIRILSKDDYSLPRCVSVSDEVVQVVGLVKAAKNAVTIISSRLMESQQRDRSVPRGCFDDDFVPYMNNAIHRSSMEGVNCGSRASLTSLRSKHSVSSPTGFMTEGREPPVFDEGLVFRILCPTEKLDRVIGKSNGIIDLLQNKVGVNVKLSDHVLGSNEQIIIILSDEGPNNELFPAQEALLHIQTCIVDLILDKENFVTTRLLIPLREIECLVGTDGLLSMISTSSGANIHILPMEERPARLSRNYEIVQILGEIKAAREALIEMTERLRSYVYSDFFHKDEQPQENVTGVEAAYQTADIGAYRSNAMKWNVPIRRKNRPNAVNSFHLCLVTRSTLEVVIPEHAVSKLITKSKNKISQISELSGAKVTLVVDRPEVTEKMICISGTKEETEKAQSLLQGFILSTLDDYP